MNLHKTLKAIHLSSTVWFVMCVIFLLVLALHEAGFKWWVIFSLSGHSVILTLLLVSLYLFAVFGASGKEQRISIEHPLTSTGLYMGFYVCTPLLGALGGLLATVEPSNISQLLSLTAMGTFSATFLTWVIVDPAATILEMLAPACRKHRLERLAADKQEKENRRLEQEAMLNRLQAQQEQDQLCWQKLLLPEAEKLTELLERNKDDVEQAEREAVDIGIRAWQVGGLDCMRQLRDTAMESYRKRYRDSNIIDHISNWWDGIGNWRTPAMG